MRRVRRRSALTGLLLVTLMSGALAAPVNAYHDQKQFIVTDTAYTLREDEWRLGLWRVDYGFWDDFYVGTYTLP
jgi:hypothetical protein